VKKADSKEVGRLIASECLSVRVRRLGRVITRIYDAALAKHGVSAAQLNLLAAIAAGDGARPGDLTRLLDLEKSTLSRDLKRMERLGWVRSEAAPARRGQLVTLTPAGARLLIDVRPAWQEAQAAAQAELGEKSFAQLRAALPSPLGRAGPR
jgi:DNA-binding MarR family transcriptional regulator